MRKFPKTTSLISFIIVLYLVLLIPFNSDPLIQKGIKKPFIWNRDSLWNNLESEFITAGTEGCDNIKPRLDSLIGISESLLNEISQTALSPADNKFVLLENNIFRIAPLVPACSQCFRNYINFYSHLRRVIKEQSRNWDINSTQAKNTLYRLLYGNRTAIEEVMLQLPPDQVPPLINGVDEPSVTPSAKILGVDIHSGDILISRGGAPTSALIARGNDYPANFSHAALVYIDKKTNLVTVFF